MTLLFHNLPTWLIGVLIIGAFVVLAVLGLLVFRRLTQTRLNIGEDMNNDIIFFASAIGVFYSLMAGLMSVAVWGNYASVQDLVSQEAASIAALYRDVTSLPEPTRSGLQAQLREYNAFIIEKTWPAARRNGICRTVCGKYAPASMSPIQLKRSARISGPSPSCGSGIGCK